jgi:hypothetical protein
LTNDPGREHPSLEHFEKEYAMDRRMQTHQPASIDIKSCGGTGKSTLTPEKAVTGRRAVAGRTLKDGDPEKNLKIVKPGGHIKP